MDRNNSMGKSTLEKKIAYSRYYRIANLNILIMIFLTVANIISILFGDLTYYFFSLTLPFLMIDLGMFICGKYPEGYYEGGYQAYTFFGEGIFYALLAISIVILAFYLLCFFMSRKRGAWLIVTLVAFSIDTVIMFTQYEITAIITDIIFALYFILSLSLAIRAHTKLKEIAVEEARLEKEKGEDEFSAFFENPEEDENSDSKALRRADFNVKSRIFLQENAFGHTIIYRRVKTTNELVIDGYVYDVYIALAERPHVLSAKIDGHVISAGIKGFGKMTITVDGKIIAKKMRFF